MICLSLRPSCWRLGTRFGNRPGLQTASRRAKEVFGNIFLHIYIGNISTCIRLGIMDDFSLNILLGRTHKDKFIKAISPMLRQVVPYI